ncbi:translation elongation factor Ts (EF-Ts) [Orenia metallireducens]|uniref:Elongation factor Ts n=1 Tax=Orenia metallireducens TaxID=1413210 RepID=A0A285FQQ8_9FIRM|nr:translation elongation factor Ts [Orenia metallireducens]PRX33643.1 translation elongation factor Ts (EF-Ts) [Orenia metallireducens]SNY12656.1 translation elongation factor Ts (EF-Ts) [Orenia metallireducens]
MAITTADIKKLREMTNAGILDCKKALQETDGDMDKAVEYLREKGIASADKKAGRTAAEGLVAFKTVDDTAAILEVNCETDFVARNENFKVVVDALADHVLAENPADVEEALSQTLKAEDKTVEKYLKESIAKIGENISFRRFQIFEKNAEEIFGTYLHMGGNIGVLVQLQGGDEDLARDIAMHIAAVKPNYLSKEDVPSEDLDKEREILTKQALAEGKPEHIVEKMVEGRLGKFYTLNCLLEQEFVKDSDITIQQLVDQNDASIVNYVRYEVGEGIEVEETDFAAEVMGEINK